jgi:hypothetical protein
LLFQIDISARRNRGSFASTHFAGFPISVHDWAVRRKRM